MRDRSSDFYRGTLLNRQPQFFQEYDRTDNLFDPLYDDSTFQDYHQPSMSHFNLNVDFQNNQGTPAFINPESYYQNSTEITMS